MTQQGTMITNFVWGAKVGHLKEVFARKVAQLWKSPEVVEPPALKVFKSWCDKVTADLIQNSR